MDQGTDSGMLGNLSTGDKKNICKSNKDKGQSFTLKNIVKEINFFKIQNFLKLRKVFCCFFF